MSGLNKVQIDYEGLIGQLVEVSWDSSQSPGKKWYKRYLVAYLPDAERPFFCVSSMKKGYSPSAWGFCREVEK